MNNNDKPKLSAFAEAASGLSLGISIVIAILLGVGFGLLLKSLFGISWLFWIGVFFGICAAILNVYKTYKMQMKSFRELEDSVKYSYKNKQD